jgi:hypothetical protein
MPFDPEIYRLYNEDLADYTEAQLLEHFTRHGELEGRIYSRNDLDSLPSDFDSHSYKSMHKDLRHMTHAEAVSHYLRFGVAEGRRYKDCVEFQGDEDKRLEIWRSLVTPKMRGRIAVVLHAGHQYGLDLLTRRLRRLPPLVAEDELVRVFVTYFDESIVFPTDVAALLVPIKVPNAGADIGPFLHVLQTEILSDPSFAYILKIHSKTDDHWREMMLDAVLPCSVEKYAWIFQALDSGASVGSEAYCYPAGRQPINKGATVDILGFAAEEYFDELLATDDADVLDADFYLAYHPDLRTLSVRGLMSKEEAAIHYAATRGVEQFRIGSQDRIVRRAAAPRRFYAGTIFWVGREQALNYAAYYRDAGACFASETGQLTNNISRYTHSWEYIFGMLQQSMAPRVTVLFLLPELALDALPASGGIRTVLRCLERVAASGRFNVKLALCNTAAELVSEHGARNTLVALSRYGEVNFENVEPVWDKQRCRCDVAIATGWQTFDEASRRLRSLAHGLLFFCQDLEYEFEVVRSSPEHLAVAERFYALTGTPTITMSNGLADRLRKLGYENVLSLPFGVNTEIYHPARMRRGAPRPLRLLLCYVPEKKHRLPELMIEVASVVGERLPQVEIHSFGSSIALPNSKVVHHGELPVVKLGELYRDSDIGVVFSSTNPSRVAFEMRACGCAVVELFNDFTRFDMPPEQFLLVDSDRESVLKAVASLVECGGIERYARTYEEYWSTLEKYSEADKFLEHVETFLCAD